MQNLAGRAWGRFHIIEERGRGGMAVVFRAYDMVLQRTVALKVLLPFLAANAEFAQRFEREAITAANLRHPNIVVIYDVGCHDNFQYIVMEFLDGLTIQQEIEARGSIPLNRVVSLVAQLASALDYAHCQGLIHRDVKPANIIVGAGDRVTLTDFGLVKAIRQVGFTGEGMATGTLTYMSPEQAMGRDLDARSDLYSLGIVVYEMLAGEVPFSATTPYAALRQLINDPPPPLTRLNPRLSPQVEQIVLQALSKDPARRFATAGEFAAALAGAAGLGAVLDRVREADTSRRQIVLILAAPDGREYPICSGQVTIGREVSNDVVLPISQVSRRHAVIECSPAGCRVTDAGSTNGTFVNGTRLAPGVPAVLRIGDVLGVGPISLLVTQPAPRRPLSATDVLSVIH